MHRTEQELAELVERARPSWQLAPGPGFTARLIAGAAAWRVRRRRARRAVALGLSLAAVGVVAVAWTARPAQPLAAAVEIPTAEGGDEAALGRPGSGGVGGGSGVAAGGSSSSMSADWDFIAGAMSELGSEEQRRRLDEAERIAIRLRADIGIAALDLRRELERGRPDPARVESLIETIGRLETELRRVRLLAWVRARDPAPADPRGDAPVNPFADPPVGPADAEGPRPDRARERAAGERPVRERPARDREPPPLDPFCDEVTCLVDSDRPCCDRFRRFEPRRRKESRLPESPGRADIAAGMRAIAGAARACGLQHGHDGTVVARVVILPSGRAGQVEVSDGSDAVRTCVARAVARARFPASRTGVTLRYPFVLGARHRGD